MTTIAVTGQSIALLNQDNLVQNSENLYQVTFSFDESWDGFAKTAIFQTGSSALSVLLTDNVCTIPAQCLKRAGAVIQIGVYGVRGEERKPTIWCKTTPVQPGTSPGVIAQSPTPDVYSQLLASIGDISKLTEDGKSLVDVISEVKESVDKGGASDEEGSIIFASDEEVEELFDDIFGDSRE